MLGSSKSSAAIADAVGGSTAAAMSVVLFYPLELLRVHMQSQLGTSAGTSTVTVTTAPRSMSMGGAIELSRGLANETNTDTTVVVGTGTSIAAYVIDVGRNIAALILRLLAAVRPVIYLLRRLQAQLRQGTHSLGGGAFSTDTALQAQIIMLRHLKGLLLRVIHTLITSFVYYQTYGVVASWWSRSSGSGSSRNGGHLQQRRRTLWGNLGASTVAAMTTVFLSLPLETMVLHAQREGQKEAEAEEEGEGETERERRAEERAGAAAAPMQAELSASSTATPTTLGLSSCKNLFSSLLESYKGLTPALLLCINPILHFGVFDYLKLKVINARMGMGHQFNTSSRNGRSKNLTYSDLDSEQLTTMQAFVLGTVAKVIATLVTFPLLRAKVLMILDEKEHADSNEDESKKEKERADSLSPLSPPPLIGGAININNATETRITADSLLPRCERSDVVRLFKILMYIYRVHGIRSGFYKGIWVHLLHTSLRAAVSMSLKEKVVYLLRNVGAAS